MSRWMWIAIAAVGGGLILALLAGDGGSLGLDGDMVVRSLALGAWASVLAVGILASGHRFGEIARTLAVWLLIILALVAGYQYRYELQDVASRITAALVPGSPLSIGNAVDGQAVRLDKLPNGHFEVRATVDGAPVRFVVDTGATTTVLSAADARRAGIDPDALSFDIPVSTANGVARAARASVDEIAVGAITRQRFPVLVAAPGALGQSLLGMNFIGSLSGFEVRGDVMFLRD